MRHSSVLQRREAFRARPVPYTAPVAIRIDGLPAPLGGHVLDLSCAGMRVALPCRAHTTMRSIAPGSAGVAYLAFLDPSQAWDSSGQACDGVPTVGARVVWRELASTRSELRVALALTMPNPSLRSRLARYVQDCDRETLHVRRPISRHR